MLHGCNQCHTCQRLGVFHEFLITVCIFYFSSQHSKKFWLVNGAITISTHLIDQILPLDFCWVLTQGPHDSSKFLCWDDAIVVFVKLLSLLFVSQSRESNGGCLSAGVVMMGDLPLLLLLRCGGHSHCE